MKREYFFQRQWAETVRLYSGLLSGEERDEFIKFIASRNVLLAAECKSISILPESELESYLTAIAIAEAKEFKLSDTSAKGIMALIELNRFDEITKIFSSLSSSPKSPLYNQVVSNYISNGSEIQISSFMVVLSFSNKILLEKAIDKAFDLNIYFSPTSIEQLEEVYNRILIQGDERVASKLICIIPKKISNIDVLKTLDILLINMEILYVEKFIKVYKLNPTINIFKYLSNYIYKGINKELATKYLDLCKKLNSNFELNEIRIELSKHLNPKFKQLAFEYDSHNKISEQVLTKMCLENIEIDNVSSIEFALEVLTKYKLQSKIKVEHIIDKLLIKPQGQRLDLAYRLIKQYSLSKIYPYQIILDFAIKNQNLESLALARVIILNDLDENKIIDSLFNLCCLAFYRLKNFKMIKDIIFNDLQKIRTIDSFIVNDTYFGYVGNIFKGSYQMEIGIKGIHINLPKSKFGSLKLNDLVKFRLIRKEEKIYDYEVAIIDKNIISNLSRNYFKLDHFIGEIVEVYVEKILDNKVLLSNENFKDITFILLIGDISNNYEKNIGDTFKVSEKLFAKILRIDSKKRAIYCTTKHFLKFRTAHNNPNEEDILINKISELKRKFSR